MSAKVRTLDHKDEWVVINDTTGVAFESHPNKEKAQKAASWCNEHELKNGRPSNYSIRLINRETDEETPEIEIS